MFVFTGSDGYDFNSEENSKKWRGLFLNALKQVRFAQCGNDIINRLIYSFADSETSSPNTGLKRWRSPVCRVFDSSSVELHNKLAKQCNRQYKHLCHLSPAGMYSVLEDSKVDLLIDPSVTGEKAKKGSEGGLCTRGRDFRFPVEAAAWDLLVRSGPKTWVVRWRRSFCNCLCSTESVEP